MHDFDAIVIGTGQAGPSLAFRLAGAGMKVAVGPRDPRSDVCQSPVHGHAARDAHSSDGQRAAADYLR